MPRAYSRDLRERSMAALDAGASPIEITHLLGISDRALRRWRQRRERTGELTPGQSPGRPRKLTADQEAVLRDQVTAHPDWTLAQHAEALADGTGVTVSTATVCRRLQELDLTLKKRPSRPANKMPRPVSSGGTP